MQQQQNQVFCCQQNHSEMPIQYICVNKECLQFHLYCFKCLQDGMHLGHLQQISFVGEFLRNIEYNCKTMINLLKNEMEIVVEKLNSYLKGIQQKYLIQENQFKKLTIYQMNAVLINLAKFDKEILFQSLAFQIKQFNQAVEAMQEDLKLDQLIYSASDEESLNKTTALYNQSYDLYKQFKFDQALKLLDQSQISNHKDSLWLKGECLKMLGDYNEALIYNEKAYHQDPHCSKVLSGKAECLRLLERYNEALTLYDQALQIQPLDAPIICGKGECLKFMNDYDEAIACFETVLLFDQNNVPSLFGKGDCLRLKGQYFLALVQFEKILKLNPFHELSKQGIQKCKESLRNI